MLEPTPPVMTGVIVTWKLDIVEPVPAAGVSAAMSNYLFTHPDVNGFFTGLQGLPKAQVKTQTQQYLDANPGIRADLDGIRQPSTDFRSRCGLIQRPIAPGVV